MDDAARKSGSNLVSYLWEHVVPCVFKKQIKTTKTEKNLILPIGGFNLFLLFLSVLQKKNRPQLLFDESTLKSHQFTVKLRVASRCAAPPCTKKAAAFFQPVTLFQNLAALFIGPGAPFSVAVTPSVFFRCG